jgi:hypothetical protein
MMKRSYCNTCRFFDVDSELPDIGECRRSSPRFIFGYVHGREGVWMDPDPRAKSDAIFPTVTASEDWCGEHENI